VALVTGWTAEEWASSSPPERRIQRFRRACPLHSARQSDPRTEAREAAHRRLHTPLGHSAHLSESMAWAIYRDRLKRFGSLIGDREPIVLHKEIPGMGRAKRYIITIADHDRAPLAEAYSRRRHL
jgi:hypothetical protein